MKRFILKTFQWLPLFLCMGLLCSCGGRGTTEPSLEESFSLETSADETADTQWEKGYDLPVREPDRIEAETDCQSAMEEIAGLYIPADKGSAVNAVVSRDTMVEMKEKLKAAGNPVISSEPYSVMENHQEMENFLADCEKGKAGNVILYKIHWDGTVGRLKFMYDGTDMYVLSAKAAWKRDKTPVTSSLYYSRIKEWRYTEKGYFCYELCVPQPPEVTEIVDGSCLVRVKPLSKECRILSETCVFPLGYQGNNLLCSSWDEEHMEELDYNGIYEYLYEMKYGKAFEPENYPDGIGAEEFETVIKAYLPVSEEQIRRWAVFDPESQTYACENLGCANYAPTFFGTSLPEVVHVEKHGDEMVTLTVDAVCDMVLCDDAVITHKLTLRFAEDGSFQYLKNEILDNGIEKIPDYQYRFH